MSRSSWVVLLGVLVFAGCDGADVPDLNGRFVGAVTRGGQSQQVVAQISGVQGAGRVYHLDFKFYPTLGSAQGQPFIANVNDSDILLRTSLLGADVLLKRQGSCGALQEAGQRVSFCWASGKIEFRAEDARGSVALDLTRDDRLPPLYAAASGRTYTLDELLGRAKFQSYAVVEEAERVFQAKRGIQAAVGELLPHLNVRDLLAIASSGYLGIFEAAGDLLPFLFPSNWYRWREAQALARAEEKSFASLRGNEMSAVELLYYGVRRDQAVLQEVGSHVAWLKRIQAALSVQEQAGSLPTGSADYFGISIRELEQDQAQLKELATGELAQLAQAVALPPVGALGDLAAVDLPDPAAAQAVDASSFYSDAQLKSFELASLRALLDASREAQGESAFGFLDPGSSGSIGFGYPATLAIGKSHEREVQAKLDETSSLIEQRSAQVAAALNSSIEGFQAADSGAKESQRRFEWLWQRRLAGDATLGDQDFLDGLADLQRKALVFAAGRVSCQYAYLAATAQLKRLLLQGSYSDLEDGLH